MTDSLRAMNDIRIVLASQSPRRQMLFEHLGFPFEVRVNEIDEHFPESLVAGEIPVFLSEQKAKAYTGTLAPNELLVTADTIVWSNGRALNKPADQDQARMMLSELSDAAHVVYTGVCLKTAKKTHSFVEGTTVTFNPLSEEEINYYLDRYAPFDKAGAYGIQEFIGLIGIKAI
jgi:septum formation protein